MTSALWPSEPIEVYALALKDLRVAEHWEAKHPDVKLVVTTDRQHVYDSIDIYAGGSSAPQWCVWRDACGSFHVEDQHGEEMDEAFLSLADALEFVSMRVLEIQARPAAC